MYLFSSICRQRPPIAELHSRSVHRTQYSRANEIHQCRRRSGCQARTAEDYPDVDSEVKRPKKNFVDMVKDHLLDKYSENELLSENFGVYTTLDPALQRAAAAAVDAGMKNVDLLLAKKYDKWRRAQAKVGSNSDPAGASGAGRAGSRAGDQRPSLAGAITGMSQLNHALRCRQPRVCCSKPFSPSPRIPNNAVDGVQADHHGLRRRSMMSRRRLNSTARNTRRTTMEKDSWGGHGGARPLTNSLNVATVKLAELIGYGRVVQVARKWASA